MIRKVDKKNRFVSMFDPKTGFYVRSGVMDENGKDTGVDPFMCSYPELIDIGIMQKCVCSKYCNVDCYQKACNRTGDNMSLENYESLLKQMKGKVFQCLDEDEVVLVRNQFGNVSSKYIKDIRVGDYIFYQDNKFVKVTDKREKKSDVFEIKLKYGKSIIATEDHKFPTVNGLKTVSELKVGDEFINIKGKFKPDNIQTLDIVKLIIDAGLDDKYFLTDCPDVSNFCNKNNIKRNNNKTVKISFIKNNLNEIDYSNTYVTKERSKYKFKSIYNITNELMILLGHFVGNGTKRRFDISKEQIKMIDAIENALKIYFPEFNYTKRYINNVCRIELNSTILSEDLFSNIFGCRTIDKEKQLPNFIYNINNEFKVSFLKGYFCDGSFRVRTDDGHYGEFIFNTSSKKLAKDIELLLVSLNVDYSVSTEEAKQVPFSKTETRIINRKKRYRIRINNLMEITKIHEVVSDHKNSYKFNNMVNDYHNPNYLKAREGYVIQDIARLENQRRVIDINVDSEEHLFMTSNGIISHNCALGGAGDVDTHENFEDIMKITREYNIVPNFTTSGIAMTKEKAEICKKYAGAVAVSEHYADYTERALNLLLDAGVTTNIHFVLNNQSIDDAIDKLKNNGFKKGINAVVFLTYKPVGLGVHEKMLDVNDPRVKEFFALVDDNNCDCQLGFDSCAASGIVNFTKQINLNSLDFCEGARYSMYIDANMNAMPCSFANQNPYWFVDLHTHTIQEAWNSKVFERFRYSLRHSCPNCSKRDCCAGGCPLVNEITLCNNSCRDFKRSE